MANKTIKKMKKQPMEWKKIYPKHSCDNELTSKKIYK